jgi:hypothetical protein
MRAEVRNTQPNQSGQYIAGRACVTSQGLANRRLQPLGHSSVAADMPEVDASRKQQIPDRPIPARFDLSVRRNLAFR